jgi:hypothetical protein
MSAALPALLHMPSALICNALLYAQQWAGLSDTSNV